MTPEGEHDERDEDGTAGDDTAAPASGSGSASGSLGWGRPGSGQPPGNRITWNEGAAEDAADDPLPAAPGSSSEEPTLPTVRSPRAADAPLPPRAPTPTGSPAPDPAPVPPATPAPRAEPLTTERGPSHPTPRTPPQRPTPPSTLRRASTPPSTPPSTPTSTPPSTPPSTSPSTPAPAAPAPGSGSGAQRPTVTRSVTELDQPPAAAPAPTPPTSPAAPPPPPAPPSGRSAPRAEGGDKVDDLKAQLRELAEREAGADVLRRPSSDRTIPGPALNELAQQLAATQAQVAGLAAQLTTLSHRLSYDLERSAQTTTERLLRDIPEEVRTRLGADLGPAIDDLTDQIETDRSTFTAAVEEVQRTIAPRLTSMGEIVDALPLSNVEVLSALHSVGTDLEDRFGRFAARVGDQLGALERATAAELTRIRAQVDDLRVLVARPSGGPEALERMAGQVERLVQSTPSSEEVVEALELLVSEHLEVLRDNLDTRVAALAPALRQEMEAIRAESLAGMAAAEEVLAERIEVLEATLAERMDLALADQVDAVDALVTDRHAQLLGAIRAEAEAREGDAGAGLAVEVAEHGQVLVTIAGRIDDLVAAVAALQEQVASRPEVEPVSDPMAAVNDELKALRRRISLRLEGESPGGLNPEQIAALAAQIADHLR